MRNAEKATNARTLSMLYQRLKRQHHQLDQKIASESQHKLPDFLRLQKLKRLRLRVKEQICQVDGVLRTIGKPIWPDAA
ncbi:MAG: YdcH family protein [Pseudomonadota bacterium]